MVVMEFSATVGVLRTRKKMLHKHNAFARSDRKQEGLPVHVHVAPMPAHPCTNMMALPGFQKRKTAAATRADHAALASQSPTSAPCGLPLHSELAESRSSTYCTCY
jgi:hypothetical protein